MSKVDDGRICQRPKCRKFLILTGIMLLAGCRDRTKVQCFAPEAAKNIIGVWDAGFRHAPDRYQVAFRQDGKTEGLEELFDAAIMASEPAEIGWSKEGRSIIFLLTLTTDSTLHLDSEVLVNTCDSMRIEIPFLSGILELNRP